MNQRWEEIFEKIETKREEDEKGEPLIYLPILLFLAIEYGVNVNSSHFDRVIPILEIRGGFNDRTKRTIETEGEEDREHTPNIADPIKALMGMNCCYMVPDPKLKEKGKKRPNAEDLKGELLFWPDLRPDLEKPRTRNEILNRLREMCQKKDNKKSI